MDQPNFQKTLENLRASAHDVDALVKHYEERINQLELLKGEAERKATEFLNQIREAERKARLANEQYQKALALREGEYQGLIRDLFETPQENLEKSIRDQTAQSKRNLEESIKEESRRTNRITLWVAVLSILASIVMAVILQFLSYRTTKSLNDSVKAVESRTQKLVDNIWQNDPRIARVVRQIQNHRGDFRDYNSESDLALMYKIKLTDFYDLTYSELIRAFEYAGIDKKLIPRKTTLRKWDEEYLALCDNALRELSNSFYTKKSGEQVSQAYRGIAVFRLPEDKTSYGGWYWSEEKMTYRDLYIVWSNQREKVLARIGTNGQEQAKSP